MKLKWKLRLLAIGLGTLFLSWTAAYAHGGALRYAGKQITKGTVVAAQTTANAAGSAAGTAAGGAASVGRSAGGAIQTGASAVAKGAEGTPSLAAKGGKALGKKIWKAVW